MDTIRFQLAVSLDGYVAGPGQSEESPLGVGGTALHDWMVELEAWRKPHGLEGGVVNASTPVMEGMYANVGAVVMGRNMFGGGPDPWREDAPGTAGGGTTLPSTCRSSFSPTIPVSLWRWRGDDLRLRHRWDRVHARAGHAGRGWTGCAARRRGKRRPAVPRAGLVDEFEVHIVPILLGGGERLLENVGDLKLEQVRAIDAPGVTHIKYRVIK